MSRLPLFAHLQTRCREPWLIGLDAAQLWEQSQQRYQNLIQRQAEQPVSMIMLAEANPTDFLAGLLAARAAQCPICLGNPAWTAAEWQPVLTQVQPDWIWGPVPEWSRQPDAPQTQAPQTQKNWILIPTGGSSGHIRFAVHTWETLTAAVQGFQTHFGVKQVNSCCLLPLYHVSGLMQFLRSFLSGGKLAVLPSKPIEQVADRFDPSGFFVSLVPTQLQRLLKRPEGVDWLKRCQTILVGGAPTWPDLLEQARRHQLRLAPTYGMTETASQVATLKPKDFCSIEWAVDSRCPMCRSKFDPALIHLRNHFRNRTRIKSRLMLRWVRWSFAQHL